MIVLFALFGLAPPALACIWDRDTLATELAGLPEVERVIYGDFDRFPPRYYEMRLERVTAELATNPTFDRYDDAAAALDRLGRSDEAIAMMERKRAAMEGQSDAQVAYRTHANLGTFLAHRWFRNGADRRQTADLDAAIAEIEAALALDPEAHFGRERVQLDILKWAKAAEPFDYALGSFAGDGMRMKTADDDSQAKTIEGLRGLVVLGAAWESVDTYHALALALRAEGRNHAAGLAGLRAAELARAGKRSIQPGAPEGEALAAVVSSEEPLAVEDPAPLQRAFAKGREQADRHAAERLAFMEARFALGMHPDTHAGFWDPVLPAEAPAPSEAAGPPPRSDEPLPSTAETGGICGCASVGPVRMAWIPMRRR
ncbi:MAG: hypothetical protein H6737_04605 [Alphaproteobacteria bacterium]|nr:hypothetical protein [Alphaproteobacteria bacterium]